MDRDRASFIAHASLDICNPVSPAKTDAAIDAMLLDAGARVLDIGAGKGEILCRVCERFGATGVAVERSAACCGAIRERADARSLGKRIRVEQRDAGEYVRELLDGAAAGEGFDACLCVGSVHALGDLGAAVPILTRLTRPGGLVLLGTGYWKRPPAPEYLEALGGREDEAMSHGATIEFLVERGLEPLWAATASDDDWDAYEWAYFRGAYEHCRAHPEDPDAPAMLERARAWRRIAQRWGRDTLGFGLYLARTGEGAAG
ncbi:MAG: class I SAM-dependent methyltransferase [Phycisphaerales bacterium]